MTEKKEKRKKKKKEKMNIEFDKIEDKEYYISTYDEDGELLVYKSENYRFSELDLLSLIKILFINRRNISIGERLLEIYRDSTEYRKEITLHRLKRMGLNKENEKPTKTRKEETKYI